MARRIDFYRISRGDDLGDPKTWNDRFEDMDLRMASAEEANKVIDQTAARAEQAALSRINDVLTPLAREAQERLTEVAVLFEATSNTPATIGEGGLQFEIPEGKRLTFAPLAYLSIFPTGDLSRSMAARTVSYDPTNGILEVEVMRVVGEGTFDDWQIAPMASVSELEGLAVVASNAANATASDRIAVAADRATAVQAKNDAVAAKGAAEMANTSAQGHLNSFLTIYRGALAADPATGQQGHFYFNTTQQMAKVYTATGWAPLFSVSLGGIRQGEIVATAGQTVLEVGAFTFMNVWRDGVKLVPGIDFTVASPNVTLLTPATAGQRYSYLGYYSTEQTDFYTKAVSDERYVAHNWGRLAKISMLVSDWNDATETGFYRGTAAATVNQPTANSYVGHTVVHSENWVTQTVWSFNGQRFFRTLNNGVWQPWIEQPSHQMLGSTADFFNNNAGKILTTDQIWAAAPDTILTDAGTIQLNMKSGINFYVLLGGNRTMANPTNVIVGKTGWLRFNMLAPRTVSWGANYKHVGGIAPSFPSAGQYVLPYACMSASFICIFPPAGPF